MSVIISTYIHSYLHTICNSMKVQVHTYICMYMYLIITFSVANIHSVGLCRLWMCPTSASEYAEETCLSLLQQS